MLCVRRSRLLCKVRGKRERIDCGCRTIASESQTGYRKDGYGAESTRQEINVSQIRTKWFCICQRLAVYRPLSSRCTGPEQKGQTYSDNRKHRPVHASESRKMAVEVYRGGGRQ